MDCFVAIRLLAFVDVKKYLRLLFLDIKKVQLLMFTAYARLKQQSQVQGTRY